MLKLVINMNEDVQKKYLDHIEDRHLAGWVTTDERGYFKFTNTQTNVKMTPKGLKEKQPEEMFDIYH